MTQDQTIHDHIRYDLLTQEALRSVVRRVLAETAKSGLPGDHHFYIAFDTTAPGVRLSTRMREKYPAEITIVLQHQFWDLAVTEHAFEVGLSFGGIPERLLVPFTALKSFYDPSVQFGLEFEPFVVRPDEPVASPAQKPAAPTPLRAAPPPRGAASEPATVEGKPTASKGLVPRVAPGSAPRPDKGAGTRGDATKAGPKVNSDKDDDDPPPPASGGADVVRLDRFRKR